IRSQVLYPIELSVQLKKFYQKRIILAMQESQVEGVVLRATPFKEKDRILTLLTPDRGVMNLYVRGLSKAKPTGVSLTTPLCRGEFVFKKGRTDLYHFIDGTILDLHLPLRRSYAHLDVAGKIVQALLKTQLPGKDSHALYQLLIAFLKHLPHAQFPKTLWTTFQIKLLKHEGLLEITQACHTCQAPATQIVNGESRCHSCGGGLPFKKDGWETLCMLFEARSFIPLLELELPSSLYNGIEACFRNHIMV
ncbi:MAG: DNA repair protein RecO, partial [Chlamydiia bacterium]|nr:DNA repair protein RecO [Chlamydiia bacterium]